MVKTDTKTQKADKARLNAFKPKKVQIKQHIVNENVQSMHK